jgi:hypothetical protein
MKSGRIEWLLKPGTELSRHFDCRSDNGSSQLVEFLIRFLSFREQNVERS